MGNSRDIALEILYRVWEQEGKSHLLLSRAFREHPELTERDRAFITGLVHGSLENQLLLDFRLNEVSKLPAEKLKPWVRTVLRMGLYQLLFLDRVPAAAVGNESVRFIRGKKLEGLSGYVNGVLRSAARKEDWKMLPPELSLGLPPELWQRLRRDFGEAGAWRIGEGLRTPGPLSLRVNLSRGSAEEAVRLFAKEGYTARPLAAAPAALVLTRTPEAEHRRPLEETTPFKKGLVQVQDVSSQLAVALAAPAKGARVLDLCAAPGGKSLHAADLVGETGSVTACDLTEDKIRLLEENIRRSGFAHIRAVRRDAAVFVPEDEAAYDLVIADLPCSGLGVMGRKPEIRFRVSEESIRELAALQRQILEQAVRYVKPGGRLLFSTCTMTAEENLANGTWLSERPELRAADLSAALPQGGPWMSWGPGLQLFPGEGWDGFYISLFERVKA